MTFDADIKVEMDNGYVTITLKPLSPEVGFKEQVIELTEKEFIDAQENKTVVACVEIK